MDDASVYPQIGLEGFDRLTRAFYRQVPGDATLGPMYAPSGADLEPARLRLRDFLIFRFGGPADYIAARGHPKLRARHFPFAITEDARHVWVRLMDRALEEAQLPEPSQGILRAFFHSTATFLINREPPAGGAGFAGNALFPVRE